MRRVTIVCLTSFMLLGVRADAPAAQTPSPIFGINLSMYGPTAPDQFVDDPATHGVFTTLGVPFVRIPIRDGVSDQRLLTVMQSVRASGARPVVILHGAAIAHPRTVDLHLLALVRSVFGSRRVYLEIGNEEDNNGVSATQYTRMWNRVVPALRANSPPSYRYGGPVAYNDDVPYITYFVKRASPRPDFISWHEYVCAVANNNRYCNSHIARWGTHVALTNANVRATIGVALPIMITEWNLDPNPDPRYDNPVFIGPWVSRALAELERLRSDGLIGAIYYTATSNADALVRADGSLTAEGSAWRDALRASKLQP